MWAIVMFGVIALLFNPIVPVHLSRSIWSPIDIAAAVAFIAAAIFVNTGEVRY